MDNFRSFYGTRLKFNPALGIFLIFLFGIPRFILVLDANSGGSYNYVSLLFLAMWITPYLLLNKTGQRLIGLGRAPIGRWWLYSLMLGMLMCLFTYALGTWLFGQTTSNWFVYIAASYESAFPAHLQLNKFTIFLTLALIGITFSPIGEELLYRGLVHQCFVPELGENKASVVDSAAFAITHLAHFGIIFSSGQWDFQFIPALLWVGLMYFSSRLFFFCKSKGGSLFMSILCHAGFNLAMTYFICYFIL